jgi:hypothetical protein
LNFQTVAFWSFQKARAKTLCAQLFSGYLPMKARQHPAARHRQILTLDLCQAVTLTRGQLLNLSGNLAALGWIRRVACLRQCSKALALLFVGLQGKGLALWVVCLSKV